MIIVININLKTLIILFIVLKIKTTFSAVGCVSILVILGEIVRPFKIGS